MYFSKKNIRILILNDHLIIDKKSGIFKEIFDQNLPDFIRSRTN